MWDFVLQILFESLLHFAGAVVSESVREKWSESAHRHQQKRMAEDTLFRAILLGMTSITVAVVIGLYVAASDPDVGS